jgi:hypothetical protein
MNAEAGFQLDDLAGIVRRRARIAGFVALACVLAAYWVGMALPNMYQSYATVLVEPQSVDETLVDEKGQLAPAWGQALGQIARGVAHEAAFGLDDAVRRARDDEAEPAPVLAALGTLSTLTQLLPLLVAGGLVLFVLLCALPLAWALFRVRQLRRQSQAHEEAALTLARAIKAAEPMAWSNELREHLARSTRGSAGAAELEQLLREHAELRLDRRERGPRSERSAHLG